MTGSLETVDLDEATWQLVWRSLASKQLDIKIKKDQPLGMGERVRLVAGTLDQAIMSQTRLVIEHDRRGHRHDHAFRLTHFQAERGHSQPILCARASAAGCKSGGCDRR